MWPNEMVRSDRDFVFLKKVPLKVKGKFYKAVAELMIKY